MTALLSEVLFGPQGCTHICQLKLVALGLMTFPIVLIGLTLACCAIFLSDGHQRRRPSRRPDYRNRRRYHD